MIDYGERLIYEETWRKLKQRVFGSKTQKSLDETNLSCSADATLRLSDGFKK